MTLLAVLGMAAWLCVLALPWRPWSTRERFEIGRTAGCADLSEVTALVPARDEADVLPLTLSALARQGRDLNIVVVDDQSQDRTSEIVRQVAHAKLRLVAGAELPAGWVGKVWALEQGRAVVATPYLLLLDADVQIDPGLVAALREKMDHERLDLVSLMVELPFSRPWGRILLPAFVFFFKLLYPFRLSNDARCRSVAAAAGGLVLLKTGILDAIGGFGALRGALIDDCTLARHVKSRGGRTWVGLTRAARAHRAYSGLRPIWDMVARTAFTQLRCSPALLLATSALFVVAFWLPLVGVFSPDPALRAIGAVALLAMALSYLPTLRYYDLPAAWALALPAVAAAYLAMTWGSAWRYWSGRGFAWKARAYGGP